MEWHIWEWATNISMHLSWASTLLPSWHISTPPPPPRPVIMHNPLRQNVHLVHLICQIVSKHEIRIAKPQHVRLWPIIIIYCSTVWTNMMAGWQAVYVTTFFIVKTTWDKHINYSTVMKDTELLRSTQPYEENNLLIIPLWYYTNMEQWWGQYGVLWICGNTIDWGEVKFNIVAEDP